MPSKERETFDNVSVSEIYRLAALLRGYQGNTLPLANPDEPLLVVCLDIRFEYDDGCVLQGFLVIRWLHRGGISGWWNDFEYFAVTLRCASSTE